MSELLSSQEIETLMQLFKEDSEGQSSVPTQLPESVRPIDLLKPNRFAREELDGFERFLTAAATALGVTISERLRMELFCDCVSVEQLRFSDWQERMVGPSALYALAVGEDERSALLDVQRDLIHGFVDRVLGGHGQVDPEVDGMTEACLTVADSIVHPLIERLRQSLSELTPVAMRVDRRLRSRASARIVGPNDVVLMMMFAVSAEHFSGNLCFALPFAVAEPLLVELQNGRTPDYDARPGAERATVEASLESVPLSVRAVLDQPELSVEQLLSLDVGDVLPLGRRVGQPVDVEVEGRVKFQAQIGRQGSRRGIQILDDTRASGATPNLSKTPQDLAR